MKIQKNILLFLYQVPDNGNDNDKKKGKDKKKVKDKKAKTITYKLKFIDSYRFMQCSLSTLVNNLSGNDKKDSCNKFTDSMRFMTDLLSQSINRISQIDKKMLQID